MSTSLPPIGRRNPNQEERGSPSSRFSAGSRRRDAAAAGSSSRNSSRARSRKGRNPFTLPSDEEVFLMRDEERRKKKEQRRRLKQLKVWEKTTASARMMTTKRVVSSESVDDEPLVSKQAKQTQGLVAAATAAISNDRRREKENMADFIAKKREMFLVQMSLDTKREEIRKLEEKAQMKEEALKKSELMLEEDAIRFDTFLKENDTKAHDAIKKAELETKLKQDKVQEIKKLTQQIQVIQSDMGKLKEQLEDCLKYKEFLEMLTPPEWFEEQERLQQQQREERFEKARAEAIAEWEEAKEEAELEWAERERVEREKAEREGRSLKRKPGRQQGPVLPPAPDLEALRVRTDAEDGPDTPMYFVDSNQLLAIFTALEESNLFLIQNSQETEQALEELKQNFRSTQREMDEKTSALKSNIDELKGQIRAEEAKAEALRARAAASTGEEAQEELLKQLNMKVKEVYRKCGFHDDANPNTLTMLTELEAKLERLLSEIEQMPEDYVLKAEKDKEKERRERVRTERMAQQQQLYERKLKKSMQRSMQAPKKKTGKQVMFRSRPLHRRVKKEAQDTEEDENAKDAQFF